MTLSGFVDRTPRTRTGRGRGFPDRWGVPVTRFEEIKTLTVPSSTPHGRSVTGDGTDVKEGWDGEGFRWYPDSIISHE